jgi:catechol 2,3-dioxygenase-like lactoylglutathione lyase family enzyme
MQIERLDHLVLTVRNMAVAREFYEQVLGLEVVEYGNGGMALRFGAQRINLREPDAVSPLVAAHPTSGSADVCLVTHLTMPQVLAQLAQAAVPVVEGPIERIGALGHMESVYIRDPDGNLLEIAHYPNI